MKKILFFLSLCANTALAQTAIATDKMNVVYIGVHNSVSIAVADATFADIGVSASQGGLTASEKGNYIWRISEMKPSSIFVKNNKTDKIDTLNFRVKRIPDPVTCFSPGGESGHFSTPIQLQQGIIADLRNFEFGCGQCEVITYTVSLLRKRGKTTTIANKGGRFETTSSELIKQGKPGDTILIENVKCRCPGDTFNRSINDIIYKIK